MLQSKNKFDVAPIAKRVHILFHKVSKNLPAFFSKREDETVIDPNSGHTSFFNKAVPITAEYRYKEYFYWHFTESGRVLKQLLCYEDLVMEEIPPVVRANVTIYYFAFQDKGLFPITLNCLLKDILWTTADKTHPMYNYGWVDLLHVLQTELNFSEGYYYEEIFNFLEETVSQLEARAVEQGLLY